MLSPPQRPPRLRARYAASVTFTPTDTTDYNTVTGSVNVAVAKATASVTLGSLSQNYDGSPKAVTTATTPSGLAVEVTYNSSSTPPTTAGSYAVVATIDDSNYQGSTNGTLAVGKLPLVVAAQNAARVYGQTNAPFTVVTSGFINGDTTNNLTGGLTFTIEDTNSDVVLVDTNTPAGTYAIIPGGLTSSDYAITFSNATLTIRPAILTVTGNSLTNIYGATLPAFTWSYSGFVNGEGSNVVAGAPAFGSDLSSGSPVADSPYPIAITQGTLSATNYTFAFQAGTLTVLPAALVVSANSVTNVYGASLPALTGSLVGVTNNDALSVLFTTSATSASHVGAYPIGPAFNDPSLLANYTVTTNLGALTVTPALLQVSADNQTRAYGYANPTLTLTYNGFAPGDDPTSLTVAPTASTTATLASHVGTYPISVGGGLSSDYTFSYTNGTLTVTKAPLTVVGNNASRAYGSPNPTFTATVTGVRNGDNLTARFSTSATTNSPPGDYTIQLNMNDPGGKMGQYNASLNSGILTITNAPLIGQVQNVVRGYGQTNPVFTVSYSGFVNGQDSNLLSGDLVFTCVDTNSVAVDTNSPVGTYNIQVASGPSAPNYAISYQDGSLIVTQAVLTVTAGSLTNVYGATLPAFTWSYAGFLNHDDSSVVTGAPAFGSDLSRAARWRAARTRSLSPTAP